MVENNKYLNNINFKKHMLSQREQSNRAGLKLMLLFSLVILLLSFTIATESLGVFKQDETVRLLQTCSICNYVTLDSIKLPNSTLLIINQNMTKSGSSFYYDFSATDLLGEYIYNTWFGNYTAPVSFEITPTGEKLGVQDAILYIIIFAVFLILFVISLYKIFNSDSISWILTSITLSYFFLIGIIFMSGKIVNNFMPTLPAIGSFMDTALTLLIIGIFPLLIFMIIYMLQKAFRRKEEDGLTSLGYTAEEAKRYRRR